MAANTLTNFADTSDSTLQLQVYVNSITLSSFISQLVILVTFIPDLAVFPSNLRILSLVTIVFSMLSPLVVFISNNYSCNPGIQAGCSLFLLGAIGKWCTYTLRIWLLSYRRNIVLVLLLLFSMLISAGTFQWYCVSTTAVRLLPRLCGPETPSELPDILGSSFNGLQNLIFIVLHVYYLWDYFREIFHPSGFGDLPAKQHGSTLVAPRTGRFTATLALCASSILVMIVDGLQYSIRRVFSSDPFQYFIIVWGSQIVSDIIYCGYMRRFATELHREAQFLAFPSNTMGARATPQPPPATAAVTSSGVQYVELDGAHTSPRPVPLEIPGPVPPAKR
ncbi:hypothetical protein M427DRAFT_68488 [Gonapodya prolifera JEL478]|uniref:Uncharacterized protein n=1 Tax=Gonapodya prolifera (strain JEL478) TaxID=1344416 RepID=A0A139AKZ7_GONPJ|nr:hypothetical protein M427DRAFT_68488 [Gonapodya prolifera JEL478]|eukprot:KXS17368.1 hypothetical protein M427DRAFT_68488 [Gonapodya prolifera JEL478]